MTRVFDETRPFCEQLSEFVLTAYARGVDVTAVWNFPYDDPITPDIVVSISQHGPRPRRRDRSSKRTMTVEAFHRGLHRLLLYAYGEGIEIEGDWEARFPVSTIPDWDISIQLDEADLPVDTEAVPTEFSGGSRL